METMNAAAAQDPDAVAEKAVELFMKYGPEAWSAAKRLALIAPTSRRAFWREVASSIESNVGRGAR